MTGKPMKDKIKTPIAAGVKSPEIRSPSDSEPEIVQPSGKDYLQPKEREVRPPLTPPD